MNIKSIQKRLAQFARERNWEKFHSPKNLTMALAVESAELLELFQWLTEEESRRIKDSEKKMKEAREEIADVMIYLLRLSDQLGIDVESAVYDKIALNEKKYPVELAKDNATKYNKREP